MHKVGMPDGSHRVMLNDGARIPLLGFGTWRIPDEDASGLVGHAIVAGYRHIDTASIYGNEDGVGRAIRGAQVPRDDIFVATKVWNDAHGRDATRRAFDASMARLGLDRLDLYLVHWPVPAQDRYVETWQAMITLRDEGRVTSIGVSNFMPAHLRRLVDETGVVPAVNQIELHPSFQQRQAREVHSELGIAIEAWSPLGQGGAAADEPLGRIGARHGRTAAQVALRWHIEQGIVAIPKSATPARIDANIDILDFTLDATDMEDIAALDRPDGRLGPDPERFG